MKKSHLTTAILIALSSTQPVLAASLAPPSLVEPVKNSNFQINKPIKFSWLKSKNATKYRLIISSNPKFGNYNASAGKCTTEKTTQKCFVATTQSLNFTVPKANPLLKTKGAYHWQVQALGSKDNSVVFLGTNAAKSGEVRPFSVSESLAIPKFVIDGGVSVEPKIAAAGSDITFNATLTTELLDGYSVKIDFGDGDLKTLTGSGVEYSYSTTRNDIGEDQSFTISIFDASGNEVDSNGDSFTITAADDVTPPIVETPPVVVKPEPVKPVVVEPVKTATVPSVSTINVSPSSVVQGNALTFSTTLSDVLPSGYSVKVDYGNGLFAMTGSGKNYSLNVAPTVSAAYSIGIYDAKNTLKSNSQTGNFSVTAPNVAPTLSLISGGVAVTLGTPYITQLSANDSNLSLIFMDWGDGATESKAATSGASVSFSHTYNSEAAFTWNATAYDSADATSPAVSKSVTVSKPVKADNQPTGTSGYTKISNAGYALSDDAKLGTAPTDWACTKDNKTGLIWEVKTDDDGLRDKDWRYSWYEPDASKNGGFAGYTDTTYTTPNCSTKDNCNTYAFTNAVNAQSLCGANDWRMPTIDELKGIVKSGASDPSIDTTYFPNTQSSWFWSSSPSASDSNYAWFVHFGNGYSYNDGKSGNDYVRLVR
jgi:hypothetical protein